MMNLPLEHQRPAIRPVYYLTVKAQIIPQLASRYPELSLKVLQVLYYKFNNQLEFLQEHNQTAEIIRLGKFQITLPELTIEDYSLNKQNFNHFAKSLFKSMSVKITGPELFYSLSAAVSMCINSKKSLSYQNIALFFVSHKNKSLDHKKLYDQLKFLAESELAA